MSEFLLGITHSQSLSSHFFLHKKEDPGQLDGVIVGIRNPDIPIEWKSGSFYYNPFFDRATAFIYREDNTLVTLNGRSVAKSAKGGLHDRSWFEVIPQPIEARSLPPGLRNMIEAIPAQVKPIAQAVMQHIGARVPADFKPAVAQDWFDWLHSVRIPIGNQFKNALRHAATTKIQVNRAVEIEFLTGKKPASSKQVHIRIYQIQEVVTRVRKIYESNYRVIDVPEEVLNKGPEATQAWIMQQPSLERQFLLETDPISEKILHEENRGEKTTGIVGYLRDTSLGKWTPLWVPSEMYSVNDVVREIMEEATY